MDVRTLSREEAAVAAAAYGIVPHMTAAEINAVVDLVHRNWTAAGCDSYRVDAANYVNLVRAALERPSVVPAARIEATDDGIVVRIGHSVVAVEATEPTREERLAAFRRAKAVVEGLVGCAVDATLAVDDAIDRLESL